MFSGLGSGGAQGCGQFARQGGFVWVQSAASCVIAHLPEAARQSGNVDFSGTPEELARELATRSELHSTSIN